jgi:vancomycin resistance protein VanJ
MAAGTLEYRSKWDQLRALIGKAANLSIGMYGVGLTCFFVLRLLVGERWGFMGLIDSLIPILLIPAVLLLPISFLWRRWQLPVSLIVPLIALVVSYGGMFIPRPVSAQADTPQITILTYNIHNEIAQLDSVVEVIRQADADLVAIQELSAEAAQAFARDLISQYPYQVMHPNTFIGQGALSKYPLNSDEYWRNTDLAVSLGHERVEIDFKGQVITLYNTHPIHPFFTTPGQIYNDYLRGREIDSVLARAEKDSTPILIAGDFNMNDQSDDYRKIAASYRDTFREVGWGFGFTFPDFRSGGARPAILPFVRTPLLARIDYVFHNGDFQGIEARVWPTSGGSDHRPVFARLALLPLS